MSFEEALERTNQYIAQNNLDIPNKMNLADEKKYLECTTLDRPPQAIQSGY